MIAIRAIIDKNNCFVDIINIHTIRVLKGFFAMDMDRMFMTISITISLLLITIMSSPI